MFHFILNQIKFLSSSIQVEFSHIFRSANAMADVLAKQGVDRLSPFIVFNVKFSLFVASIALVYQLSFPGLDWAICKLFLGPNMTGRTKRHGFS